MLLKDLKKIFYIIDKNFKTKTWIIFFLSIIGTVLELVGVGIIIPIVNMIMDQQAYFIQIKKLKFFADKSFINDENILLVTLLFLFIFFVSKNIYLIWFSYLKNKYCTDMQVSLSNNLLISYFNLEYILLLSKDSSEIIRNCLKEVGILKRTVLDYMNLLIDSLIVFSIFAFLQIKIPQVTILLFIIITSILVIYYFVIKNYIYMLGDRRLKYLTLSIKKLTQFILSLKEIKIFNKTDKMFNDFKDSNYHAQNFMRIKGFITETTKYFLEIFVILLVAVVIYYYSIENKTSNEIITALAVLIAASFKIFPSLSRINSALQTIKYNSPSTNVLYNEIQILNNNKKKQKNKFPFKAINSIKLENLGYGYNSNDNQIINNLNFNFKKGETVGIYGDSGKGKTTLSTILSGLIKQKSGKIFVNDKEIDLTSYDLSNVVGYVPQNSYLIDDTIVNNIALGEFKENINLDRINSIIKITELEKYINQLKNGINSTVGESGLEISGGQRQRICIARSLYKKPLILILDEPTSSLDQKTSDEIMKTLKNTRDLIKIIVTHKEQDLHYFDRVLKL